MLFQSGESLSVLEVSSKFLTEIVYVSFVMVNDCFGGKYTESTESVRVNAVAEVNIDTGRDYAEDSSLLCPFHVYLQSCRNRCFTSRCS